MADTKEDDASLPGGSAAVLRAVGRYAALAAVPAMFLLVLSPLLMHPWTLGQHNWDQMNTQRQVVVTTLARYHQFPFWDPYTCGGHPAWGSLESAPIMVSPFLPAYLLLPLPIAIRLEILGWALFGALGFWRLASRFTASTAVRALVVVVSLLNSRWGMQIGAGHSWHLLYALLPWTLLWFDRSLEAGATPYRVCRDRALAGGAIALMAYGDGIYPVPHTAFALLIYAAVLARTTRSWRPMVGLAWTGATAVGLAAAKLLPLSEALARFPRLIKSDEAMWPQYLYGILTWREGDYTASAPFATGMWHEWGLYLGWPALVGLVAAVVASRGPRERALKWAGFIMLSFVLGGFHPLTPWRLLHLLPVFKSQHVPSRWLYVAVIFLAVAGASGAERWLRRRGARRPVLEAVLGVAALGIALQMGSVTREPLAQSFVNPAPSPHDPAAAFHLVHRLPPQPDYVAGLWDVATLPSVLDNVGTLECDTDNGIHITHRNPEGRAPGVGAYGDNDPDYRGEAYVAERSATARVVSWTPNDVEVRVEGAQVGDHIVLNQNWDSGWNAGGSAAIAYRDAVSTLATSADETVRFHYWPRTELLGLAATALTLASIAFALWRAKRRA